MFQCPYCDKWCTISGTRALSKHIENEHRPQVIIQFLSDVAPLSVKLSPGETRLVYVAFVPLDHWNVQVDASIGFSSPTNHPWASLHSVEELSNTQRPNRGRESLNMKVGSSQPYLPRPTWVEEKHCKQRMGIRIASTLKEAFDCDERGMRPLTGFAVKFEGFAGLSNKASLGEIDVNLNLHGKETSFILPLTLVVDQRTPSSAGSEVHSMNPVKDQRRNSPDAALDLSHLQSPAPGPSISISAVPSMSKSQDLVAHNPEIFHDVRVKQDPDTRPVDSVAGHDAFDKVPSVFVGRDEPAASFAMAFSGSQHVSSTATSSGMAMGGAPAASHFHNINPLLLRTLMQMQGTGAALGGSIGSMGSMSSIASVGTTGAVGQMGGLGSRTASGQPLGSQSFGQNPPPCSGPGTQGSQCANQ